MRWLLRVLLPLTVVCLGAISAAAQPEEAAAQARPAPRDTLTLEEAYRLALQSHEQVQIAQKELEKARLAPLKAWTLITPRASFLGRYTRYSQTLDIAGQPAGTPTAVGEVPTVFPLDLWQGDLQVVQPIYESTFLTRRRASGNIIDAAGFSLDRTAKTLLFRVASAYYEVLKAQSLVEVARQTLDLANESLRVAKARFAVGEETRTAVLRAEVDVTRAERDLTQAANNLKLQQAVLANLINRDPGFEVVTPAPLEAAEQPLRHYIEQAFDYRDDLKIQGENLKLAQYDRDLVREELYPEAQATFTYSRVTPQTLIQIDDFWNLVVSLDVPIFEGGLTYLNLSEAGKSVKQAELRLEDLKKQIEIEVEDAYLQVRTLASTLATLEKQAELAAENYDIVFKQFQVGVATSLDVTDALTALKTARTDLANERYNYQVALLALQQATGTFGLDYVAGLVPKREGFKLF